ncbi:MAG: serine/threonine protein phosphatase, partial [Clostridia bacterium]|nr:serine/threonine protein phosphatase [Clostridia bacterium]
ICDDWNGKVADEDVVLISVDIIWGTQLEEGLFDLKRLSPLKGKKIFIKGNHDFWWNGITKLRDRRPDDSFIFLQN